MTILRRNILELSTEIILPYILAVLVGLNSGPYPMYKTFGWPYLVLSACFVFAGLSARSLFRYNKKHIKQELRGWQYLWLLYFSLLLGIIISSWAMGGGLILSWLGDW